jgi:hypothetical protein
MYSSARVGKAFPPGVPLSLIDANRSPVEKFFGVRDAFHPTRRVHQRNT